MANLLQETIDFLKEHGKTENDVLWVGRNDDGCSSDKAANVKNSWEWFKKNADFEYDDDLGINEIPLSLIIVGKDFWLERHEYDGAEWFEFKTMPKEPDKTEGFYLSREEEDWWNDLYSNFNG